MRRAHRPFGRAVWLFVAPPHITRALRTLRDVINQPVTDARPFGRAVWLFVTSPHIARTLRTLRDVIIQPVTDGRPFGRAVGLPVASPHIAHISRIAHALRALWGVANTSLDAFHFERNAFDLLGVLRAKPLQFVDLAFLTFDIPFSRVGACAGTAHIRVDVHGRGRTVRDARLDPSFHGTVALARLVQLCSEFLEFFGSRALALDAFTAIGVEDFPRSTVDPRHCIYVTYSVHV